MISARTLWTTALVTALVLVGSQQAATAAPPVPDTPAVVSTAAAAPEAQETREATGAIIGALVYTNVKVDLDGYEFVGNGGGTFSAGAGVLFGTLSTPSVTRLVSDTRSFMVSATPLYVNVTFFDADHTPIGTLHSGAVSTVVGIGGGTGSWTTKG